MQSELLVNDFAFSSGISVWMPGCPLTSTTSTRCRSTISTTWPPPGCTTSPETMPQHKWWEPPSGRSLCNKSSLSLWTFTDSHFAFWAEAQQPGRTGVRFLLWSWSSFFYLSLFRSSMRSETTRIPSCTCWLCRVSTLPGTPLPSERAMRSVQLLSLCLRHTGLQ